MTAARPIPRDEHQRRQQTLPDPLPATMPAATATTIVDTIGLTRNRSNTSTTNATPRTMNADALSVSPIIEPKLASTTSSSREIDGSKPATCSAAQSVNTPTAAIAAPPLTPSTSDAETACTEHAAAGQLFGGPHARRALAADPRQHAAQRRQHRADEQNRDRDHAEQALEDAGAADRAERDLQHHDRAHRERQAAASAHPSSSS